MKKKAYEQPQINVIEVEQADIIATSTTGYNEGPLNINGGSGYTLGEDNF